MSALLVACTSTKATTQAPAAQPAPTASSGTEPVVSQEDCRTIASLRKERCASDEAKVYAQCDSYVDLVAKTGCRREARASFDCGLASVKGCSTKDCCRSSVTACDAIDLKFTDCIDPYCKAHKSASECSYVPQ